MKSYGFKLHSPDVEANYRPLSVVTHSECLLLLARKCRPGSWKWVLYASERTFGDKAMIVASGSIVLKNSVFDGTEKF